MELEGVVATVGSAAESPESLAAWLAGINADLPPAPTATYDETILSALAADESDAESRRAEALRVLGGNDA